MALYTDGIKGMSIGIYRISEGNPSEDFSVSLLGTGEPVTDEEGRVFHKVENMEYLIEYSRGIVTENNMSGETYELEIFDYGPIHLVDTPLSWETVIPEAELPEVVFPPTEEPPIDIELLKSIEDKILESENQAVADMAYQEDLQLKEQLIQMEQQEQERKSALTLEEDFLSQSYN